MYEYECKIIKVIDGDTIDVSIDLGFNIHITERIRMANINAPETRTKDTVEKSKGFIAKEWLKTQVNNAHKITVHTGKDIGKYGRWIGTLFTTDKHGITLNINEEMITLGLAKRTNYE